VAETETGLPGVTGAVLAAASRLMGTDVRLVGPTSRGESCSAFHLRSAAGDLVLKLTPDRPGAQVEWTVRHRPGGAEESRFVAIANHVLDECGGRSSS
jgi:hypothetical protein